MLRLPIIALSSALLFGCATAPPVAEKSTGQAVSSTSEAAISAPERPFPDDSFYDLLVAEFALRRQQYDITLTNYLNQAPILRDAGVSAHTTHLAQFLQREDAALDSARLWVELEPDNTEVNNTMANLLAQQGRPMEALPYMRTVEQQTGAASFPLLLNGFSELSDQQRSELSRELDALQKQHPQSAQLLLTQALIHAEDQQFDRALTELQALLVLEPEQPQAILLEARILVEQGADNPYARLQRVLEENPQAKKLRLQYARMLTTTDIAAAREQFELLSAQEPQDSDLMFSLALINREMGEQQAARDYLLKTVALGRRADEANYYLGRMAEEDSDTEAAVGRYMQVKIGPEYLPANSRIGTLLIEDGQLDRSHAWFETQRDKFPQLREQLFALEVDILTRTNADAAQRVATQGLKALPASTSLRYANAMLLEQQGDLAGMERDLRAILDTDPDNTTALNALGYTLANRTTRYAEAQALILRALELQPGEPAILDSMGWVLYRNGQYDEAADYLRRAYAQFPDPEVAAHLGEVLWVQGNTEEALAVWQAALAGDPDHTVLLETLLRFGVDPAPMLPATATPAETQP